MKKILIIHPFGGIGGAGISLVHIVRALDKSLYQVVVIVPATPDDISKTLQSEECQVITSKTSPVVLAYYSGGIKYAFSPRSLINILRVLRDVPRMTEYLVSVKPDIIITNSITLSWIGPIAKRLGIPALCFVRESFVHGLFGIRKNFLLTLLSKYFVSIAFISKYDLEQANKIRSKKFLIHDRVEQRIYDKIERNEARLKLGLSTSDKYILYVGGIANIKGSHVIMKAMHYINTHDAKLICLAASEQVLIPTLKDCHSVMEFASVLLGLDARVRTFRIYYRHRLKDRVIVRRFTLQPEFYYKACDLIVFPSTKAHQSRPIFEAGVAGIPVIITDFPQTKEFAIDGKTAFTFPNSDSLYLAKQIDYVLAGGSGVEEVTKANLVRSRKDHDLATLSEQVNAFLETTVFNSGN